MLDELSSGASDIGLRLSQDFCWALTRRLEPKTAKALLEEKTLASSLSSLNDVAALLKASGLALDLPPGARLSGQLPAQVRVCPQRVLEDRIVPYGILVEGDHVRVGAMDEILERWRGRLK